VARISKVVDAEMVCAEFRAVKEELRCGEFLKKGCSVRKVENKVTEKIIRTPIPFLLRRQKEASETIGFY